VARSRAMVREFALRSRCLALQRGRVVGPNQRHSRSLQLPGSSFVIGAPLPSDVSRRRQSMVNEPHDSPLQDAPGSAHNPRPVGHTLRGARRVRWITGLPNKELKLTKPGRTGALQLNSGVRWTESRCTQRTAGPTGARVAVRPPRQRLSDSALAYDRLAHSVEPPLILPCDRLFPRTTVCSRALRWLGWHATADACVGQR
jgi:hypothetical protein